MVEEGPGGCEFESDVGDAMALTETTETDAPPLNAAMLRQAVKSLCVLNLQSLLLQQNNSPANFSTTLRHFGHDRVDR